MSMFFTRWDKNLRVWFQAVTSAGQLRTGINSGSFTIVVVNNNDSANTVPSVVESVQKPGLYYFDIPSSFFTTSGVGDYGISIQIDTIGGGSTAPHVRSAMSDVVHITHEDFDTISGSVWSTTAASFNVSGTMGFLENMISTVSGATTANAIASDVWNAVAANFNTSGTFGWLENQEFLSSSQTVTVNSIVSGVWNANPTTFNSAATFGNYINTIFADVVFQLSATFVASGTIINGTAASINTSLTSSVGQYNGMLLLIQAVGSGSQTRNIDTFNTGTFDVDFPLTINYTTGDKAYVLSTTFTPSYGYVG